MARYPTTPMCDGELLEAFEPTARDSDIFCATAPKCGQTWLLALMYHLRSKGHDPKMGGEHPMRVMPWLELPGEIGSGVPFDHAERLGYIASLPDPRIFKMHVIYEEIPRPSGSQSRVVTITRDPRDLPYSMYCHLGGMGRLSPEEDADFDLYFERWMEHGYFYDVVCSFWPHRDAPDVLWLRYEDLKADLRGEATRIARFLGFDLDDADLDRVLPLVDMKHMQAEEDAGRIGARHFREGHRFFREGAVGKNRARLSEAQQARVIERARERFEPACFDFVVSQGAD